MNSVNVALLPFSWLYGFAIAVRNLLYDGGILRVHRVGAPVVSVGNLTVGGSGKTPLVEYIVERLLEERRIVAVVSRGYKRSTRGTVVVSDGRSILASADESGDEPFQIARRYPAVRVVVDEKRVRGAEYAVRELGASVIVLDDGYQHRSIARDLDILVVDVERPPQETAMLPAGYRREPLSAVKRAHAIVYSRWSVGPGVRVEEYFAGITRAPRFKAVFSADYAVPVTGGPRGLARSLSGKKCLGFCGIARPDVFRKSLVECGAALKDFLTYPDHYAYTLGDVDRIVKRGIDLGVELFATTEKDAVRLSESMVKRFRSALPLYYVEVRAEIIEKTDFLGLLKGLLKN